MLAALRVLHVAPSHTPAPPAWIEERPSMHPSVTHPETIGRVALTPTDVRTISNDGDGSAWERPAFRL